MAYSEEVFEKEIDSYITNMEEAVKLGDFKRVIKIGEDWFKKSNKILNEQKEKDADIWVGISIAYYSIGQYEAAIKNAANAEKIVKRLNGENYADLIGIQIFISKVYKDWAINLYKDGLYNISLNLMLKALEYINLVYVENHPESIKIKNNLGLIYSQLSQYEKALSIQLNLENLLRASNSSDNNLYIVNMNNLALTYYRLADYEKAEKYFLTVINHYSILTGSESSLAIAYSNLSQVRRQQNKFDLALISQLKAEEILEKNLGPWHINLGLSSNNLGTIYMELSDYPLALKSFHKSLKIYEFNKISRHPDLGLIHNNLGYIYRHLGQFEIALVHQKEALENFKATIGLNNKDAALIINNLAWIYANMREYDISKYWYYEALKIRELLLGEMHPDVSESLGGLANVFADSGGHEEALRLRMRAHEISIKNFGLMNNLTSLALVGMGISNVSLGRFDIADKLFLEALNIRSVLSGNDHHEAINILANIGYLEKIRLNISYSIVIYKMVVNLYQEQRVKVSRIGSGELLSYTKTIEYNYGILANLLVQEGRLAEAQQVLDMLKEDELFEFIRRSSNADPRRTRIGFTPDEARWSTGYKEVSDRLAALGVEQRELLQKTKLGLSAAEKARAEAIKAELAVAEKAFTKFLSEMRNNLKAQGPTKVDEVAATSLASQRELQSIIRDLGPDVVLLQYYVTSSNVGVILTTPNVVIPFSTEIDAKVLNRQVFNLKNALRDPKLSALGPSQSLYQLLLAPVAKALEQTGAKTVMLSLDGQLRHIPFGALHDGTQFAAQRWNFPIYTSVTRDRLRGGGTAKWKAAGLGVTKAIGSFDALPAVKVEMDGLLRAAGGQSGQSVVYLDEKFTAQRLKEVGQRDFQLMHISSHFSISPGTEVNSFLLLGDGQRLTLGDMRTQNFRFDNVDLLTLSACDTGVGGGRDNTGKEIEGLGVIAQQQGAKGVLATLWPVADGSTAKLMTDMYQRHQTQGLSKIEALRQAQLAMMSQPKYAHPFYWAPFILLGNWQ